MILSQLRMGERQAKEAALLSRRIDADVDADADAYADAQQMNI